MNDFDERFKRQREDFERNHQRTQRFIYFSWVFNTLVAIAILVFFFVVTYKLLVYFGVW